jgi:hypothetical protein
MNEDNVQNITMQPIRFREAYFKSVLNPIVVACLGFERLDCAKRPV